MSTLGSVSTLQRSSSSPDLRWRRVLGTKLGIFVSCAFAGGPCGVLSLIKSASSLFHSSKRTPAKMIASSLERALPVRAATPHAAACSDVGPSSPILIVVGKILWRLANPMRQLFLCFSHLFSVLSSLPFLSRILHSSCPHIFPSVLLWSLKFKMAPLLPLFVKKS